jgi:DNA-binding response OmpR family regulator
MIARKDKVHGKSFVVFGGDVKLVNSLERMLLFAGANVEAATTAKKGISDTTNLRPDIVIYDDSTSDLDPSEVFLALQTDKLTKDIPIIIVTGQNEDEPYRTHFKSGVQDYIKRSEFDVMQVVLQIEAILRRNAKDAPKSSTKMLDLSEAAIEKLGKISADLRVLIIEDDPLLRNLLSIRLQKSNIVHQFWNSGADAVTAILEYKPSVIILDLMLPGKNGMDVLSEMRDIPSVSQIPVIIFSNKDDDAIRDQAAALFVEDFMVKATTDLGELIKLIVKRGSN